MQNVLGYYLNLRGQLVMNLSMIDMLPPAPGTLRVSPKSLLSHSPVAERPIDIGGFEALEHQVYSTDP